MSDVSSEKITEQLESLDIEKKDSIDIDVNELDFDKLIELISEYSQSEKVLAFSKTVENIKSVFYTRIRKEKSIIFNKHINEGGTEENFEFTHSSEENFKKAYQSFKSARNKERKNLEKNQEENLKVKLDIIEKIKELINGTETIKTTFDQFNELQTKWRETGHTPIKANNDLWNSYHHNVEKFYDYININRDLRDLDFKRNLEKKIEICLKAEALLKEKSINKSHKELQNLHENWKEIGPVEKEKREEVWQRFKDATHTLNKKRNEHFLELKSKNAKNAKLKNEISIQIAELSNLETKEHKAWVELSEKVKELESKWKSIGKLEKTENKKAWNNFREALNKFYSHKNNFYKAKKEDYKKAVEEKENLCLKVEKLVDSKEWKNTNAKIIKLQEDWKKTSFVPRKQSDALWNRFRTACDTFFNNKKSFFDQLDKEKENNYKTKSSLLKSLNEYSFGKNKEENLKKIDTISKDWNKIGDVPKKYQKIESDFNSKINSIYNELKIDLLEVENIKFKNKLDAFKSSPDSKKIENEKNFIRAKISEIEKEINQYENNISFFGNSKGAEPLKKQVQSKIDAKVKEINSFKGKLKMLNTI